MLYSLYPEKVSHLVPFCNTAETASSTPRVTCSSESVEELGTYYPEQESQRQFTNDRLGGKVAISWPFDFLSTPPPSSPLEMSTERVHTEKHTRVHAARKSRKSTTYLTLTGWEEVRVSQTNIGTACKARAGNRPDRWNGAQWTFWRALIPA